MNLILHLAAALMLLTAPAQAETVLVKSGEHATFSRLVLNLEAPTDWRMGRTENGYSLQLARPEIVFDLARVFDLIPRRRILDVTAPAAATLALKVASGTYASAFEIKPGTIVLDVVSGTAPVGSRFEAPLSPESPGAQDPLNNPARRPSLPLRLPTRSPFIDTFLGNYWQSSAPPLTAETSAADHVASESAASIRDPRVTEAEGHLLTQLSRAASQGLVTITLPGDLSEPVAELASTTTPQNDAPHEATPNRPEDHIALRSETVFDRDAKGGPPAQQLNPVGLVCLPAAAVDVGAWASDHPAALQIGSAQTALLGEFDKPSPDAVLALARLYLALGMGAEVAALLDGFAVDPVDSDVLRAMAAVIDDRAVATGARLTQMADCDSPAALWAILSNRELKPGDARNTDAVLRGFSLLPLNLRLLLGPRLAERLITLGAESAARTVRDAITRAPGNHESTTGLIDADIDMARGAHTQAAAALGPIIAENGPDAPRALALYVDSLLASGASIDLALVEAVAALAFEHREAPDGATLARAHILAAGASGLFVRAFDALGRMPKGASPEFIAQTTAELLRQLASTPDEVTFVTEYFRSKSMILQQNDWPLQLQTAERLLVLGFPAEARQVLGPKAVRFDAGRLLRARAAIMQQDGAAALAEIAGLSGTEAARARADALRLTGDHDAARRAYLLLEALDLAGAEAWSAGDWSEVMRLGTPPQMALVKALGLAATEARDAADAPGSLAATRTLLAESRNARAALDLALAENADR
ncbi:MAG: hypothetical protein CVT82_09350 [Alphaproteobacteria bacterium HGW-Alphaproteobacteria-4]|nr:MAG: hypothetical protein CVT82_09350 [Alphaproteobacteria bacterium HGW-Alphaproteobacteria-4]